MMYENEFRNKLVKIKQNKYQKASSLSKKN